MSKFLKKIAPVVFASLVIAAGLPALGAAAGPAVTPANGNDVVLPDGGVYQLNDDGSYSRIPDPATANAMGLDWDSLQRVESLPGPVGNVFPSVMSVQTPAASGGPAAAQANGKDFLLPDGSVCQLNDDGSYSWIPDVATANAMGLDWDNLQPVDSLPGPLGTPFAKAAVGR